MNFGTEKTIFALDNKGSTLTNIAKYRNGDAEKVMKHYKVRVKVHSSQDEMTEFMRFTDEVERCRKNGTLTWDKDDPLTRPVFMIDYPKENRDNSYFIIKSYTIFDIN